MDTPIELIAAIIDHAHDSPMGVRLQGILDVLVPEQCLSIFIDGKLYHLTLEQIG